MSDTEEQLHARADLLDETGDLAATVTEILVGASDAGVDPRAIVSLRAAIRALDPAGGAPGYQASSRTGRAPRSGYGSDSELLEAVSDAEDQIRDWLRDVERLQEQLTATADQAQDGLARAQRDLATAQMGLAAALAMSTQDPCTGCHSAKTAAIAAAEADITTAAEQIRDAAQRIRISADSAEILDPLDRRLRAALQALRQVPYDLGEVYELIYQFIRRGGKMPRFGRWIQGAAPA